MQVLVLKEALRSEVGCRALRWACVGGPISDHGVLPTTQPCTCPPVPPSHTQVTTHQHPLPALTSVVKMGPARVRSTDLSLAPTALVMLDSVALVV